MKGMRHDYRMSWFFAAWAAGVVLTGGILTSFHQPFRLPDEHSLSVVLAQNSGTERATPQWTATHLLSGSCGCSRRVMDHLIQRRQVPGVTEQVVIIDGGEAYLPGTAQEMTALQQSGFKLRHIADEEMPVYFGLHGVPLLVVTAPGGSVVYLGGYGTAEDGYEEIFRKVRSGVKVAPLPVVGCAIGRRNRRSVDPFRLKY